MDEEGRGVEQIDHRGHANGKISDGFGQFGPDIDLPGCDEVDHLVDIDFSAKLFGRPHRQGRIARHRFQATAVPAPTQLPTLGDGGQVTMPLAKTFFSPRFGMLTDKFGVGWMVLVQ